MPRSFLDECFADDFAEEMTDQILIQPWSSASFYGSSYGEGATYDCHIQYEVFQITKTDGTLAITTAQIYLNGDVVVTVQDKITFNGISPKIQRISPDPDGYGIVIFT